MKIYMPENIETIEFLAREVEQLRERNRLLEELLISERGQRFSINQPPEILEMNTDSKKRIELEIAANLMGNYSDSYDAFHVSVYRKGNYDDCHNFSYFVSKNAIENAKTSIQTKAIIAGLHKKLLHKLFVEK